MIFTMNVGQLSDTVLGKSRYAQIFGKKVSDSYQNNVSTGKLSASDRFSYFVIPRCQCLVVVRFALLVMVSVVEP